MKKISFNGKDYVKASDVAKQFRYTQDYVGQLCRSKKVDARLVGRNWYVDPDSVVAYRKTKHQTQKSTAARKAQKTSAATKQVRHAVSRKVEPVLRTKTARQVRLSAATVGRVTMQYEADETSLIPILDLAKKTAAKSKQRAVRIDAPKEQVLAVATEQRKHTKFTSDKLPEISLSGKLSVTNSTQEAPQTSEDETLESQGGSEAQEGSEHLTSKEEITIKSDIASESLEERTNSSEKNTEDKVQANENEEKIDLQNLPVLDTSPEPEEKSVIRQSSGQVSSEFTPKSVVNSQHKLSFVFLMTVLVVSLFCAALLLFLESEVRVSAEGTTSKLTPSRLGVFD